MYNNLPENISLPELEKDVLDYWKWYSIFEKSIKSKAINKAYTFYEGPPTANGLPGIHHVISRAVKDQICRYKTMQGYQVHRKAGWDTHGLPVEVEVEKELGIKSKDEIIKFGATEFNNACKKSIFKYLKQWEILTERMGYWINLDDAYITFHNEYIESVWWALKRFYNAGLIYKGFKIQPFCPVCESPLSSHEVAQGYTEITEPSIYIKLKINTVELKDWEFLVWTTTPWTLPSNVALSVNPEETYVKIITSEGHKLILAEPRLSVLKGEYEITERIKGKALEYVEYRPLFDFFELEKKSYYVTTGDFVTMEDGTGIVHIAPAYGEDDYNIGIKYDLPVLQAVLKNGFFRNDTGFISGKNFKEADKFIIDFLKQTGRLYKKEQYTHSYPHCWRHKVPLMYYATNSWFIETTKYKERMIELNNQINWNPAEIGTGRFGNWLEENKDWALSRDRFWGTPLPIWYYTDENGDEHYECIGSIEELKNKAVNYDETYPGNLDLHKPYIDNLILISKNGKPMKRVSEVIDCWFDSGSMPFAQYHYPFENAEEFENNYPADFIAEGIDQTRGWFYSMHAIGTFLFDKPAYKNLIVNGLILDKNGKKMSKSLGNAVNPFEIMDKYGADILRWYLIASSPMGKSKLFNEEDLKDIKNKFFDTLINTYRFFVIYSNLTNFEYSKDKFVPVSERQEIDKWIISKMNSLKKNYYSLMDNYDITKGTRIISDFTIDELSNWYVRRNRRRFRNPENEKDRLSAYQTLYEVIMEVLKMLATVSPFISEKLYHELKGQCESIHLDEFTEYKEQEIDTELENRMLLAQRIVYIIRSIRVKHNLKVRQPLRQILIPILSNDIKEKISSVKDIILDEINVKALNLIESDSEIIRKRAKPNFKSIGPKFGKEVKKVQNIINSFSNYEIDILEKNNEISYEEIVIKREDVEIYTENIEGWIVESDYGLTVALDTNLDKELIEEGILREFTNRVQNYRKTNNFEVNDKIIILVKATDKIYDTINNNFEYLAKEVLCKEIKRKEQLDKDAIKTNISGEECEILIKKIK
ncbi:MAG: isoleucine--tRNA ligase [Ignavibacteria bacterium]|nr:isoleucine--tRNA ligase [Ignavibacteria bacterium]